MAANLNSAVVKVETKPAGALPAHLLSPPMKRTAVMGAMALPFNTFAMDDGPVTPLYLPEPYNQSFDQDLENPAQESTIDQLISTLLPSAETHHRETGEENMKDEQILNNNCVKNSTEIIASPSSSFSASMLSAILESIPFDIDQFLSQNNNIWDDRKGKDPILSTSSSLREQQIANIVMEDPVLTSSIEANEDPSGMMMMDFEEMDPFSSFFMQVAPSSPSSREGLELELLVQPAGTINKTEEVTTPDVIETILQVTDNIVPKVIVPKTEVDEEGDPVVPAVVADLVPQAERPNRKRKASSRKESPSSDLRRVKNNEASKRSRANRRQRQQGQVQLVSELEEENRSLAARVKELEELKDKMMFHMTNKL